MIKVSGVDKHFDDFKVLDNFYLEAPRGAIYGLVGPNGAGKTTIINHITGVLKPERGTITVNGEDVWENERVKQSVLSIADDWFYFGSFTVKQMAAFYRSVYPTFNDARYEAIKPIFGIDEKRQIRKLSKGMKKQVAFWLSLSAMPEALILDEPLDGLDPVMRKQVLNLVIADVADRNMTVLVSSHNLRELEDVCDHVGIMNKGKVLLERSLSELQENTVKMQIVFRGEGAPELPAGLNLLHESHLGRVFTIIFRGNTQQITERLAALDPVYMEAVPLTLEEIFIYELGGADYAVRDIVL